MGTRDAEGQGKGNQLLLWQTYNKYALKTPHVCYQLPAASLCCYTSVWMNGHIVCLLGLWPPPLAVPPRSLLPGCPGGLCCSLVIAFCYICPYPRATSSLLHPTMVLQSIYRILLFIIDISLIIALLRGLNLVLSRLQPPLPLQGHIQVTAVLSLGWVNRTVPDLCRLVTAMRLLTGQCVLNALILPHQILTF